MGFQPTSSAHIFFYFLPPFPQRNWNVKIHCSDRLAFVTHQLKTCQVFPAAALPQIVQPLCARGQAKPATQLFNFRLEILLTIFSFGFGKFTPFASFGKWSVLTVKLHRADYKNFMWWISGLHDRGCRHLPFTALSDSRANCPRGLVLHLKCLLSRLTLFLILLRIPPPRRRRNYPSLCFLIKFFNPFRTSRSRSDLTNLTDKPNNKGRLQSTSVPFWRASLSM